MDPDELVDHLEATHHAYLHAELPRLSALVDKVTAVHGRRHPELSEIAARLRRRCGPTSSRTWPRRSGSCSR